MDGATPSLTELLAHAGWVRELARELVFDPARVDDVVQETWLSVLQTPPAHGRNLRGWLRRVVVNTARGLGRSEGRRRRREAAGARSEVLPSTAELVGELEWQRLIAAAVLEIEEPYLSTLLLRFYRGLEPAEIARAQSVSPGTVRSRLKRGLELLRERFDREHGGDRRAWSALVLRGLAPEPVQASGALLVAGLVTLLALLVGTGLYRFWSSSDTHAQRDDTALALALEAPPDGATPTAADVPDPTLVAPTLHEPPSLREPASLASAAAAPAFLGRVLAPDGAPIAGARLSIYASGSNPATPLTTGTSDADGRFRISAASTASIDVTIRAEADGFQERRDPVLPGREIPITLLWLTEVLGTVRDAGSGAPIEGVTLRCQSTSVLTDSCGRYRLPGVPTGNTQSLEARHPAFVKQDHALFLRTNEPFALDWELEAGVPISIEVVDRESGRALAGVPVREVRWNLAPIATTDGQGRFELHAIEGLELDAFFELDGYCPTYWSFVVTSLAPAPAPRILVQPFGWITGRVVDEVAAPVAGAKLYASCEAVPMQRFDLPLQDAASSGVLGTIMYWIQDEHEVITDALGRFRAAVVPWDLPHGLHVRLDGYVPLKAGPYLVPSSADGPEVELVLARGAILRGRVLRNGEPWTEIHGSVALHLPSGQFVARAGIGRHGQYEIGGVPAGELRAFVQDDLDRTRMEAVLRFEPGQVIEHDFEFTAELAPISGRVLAAKGGDIVGVWVSADPVAEPGARGALAPVERDGSFTLQVPPGCEYRVMALASRFDGPTVRATPGDEGIVLRLPEVAKLRLELVEEGSGRPVLAPRVDGHSISLRRHGRREVEHSEATVDVHGILEVECEIGVYDLRLDLQEHGYIPLGVAGVEVRNGAGAPRRVVLRRGVEVQLTLTPEGSAKDGPRPEQDHLVFLVEREQLDSIAGPYAEREPPSNNQINGICMRIDDPAMMNQMLTGRFYRSGIARLSGLAPGHYLLKCYPDDFVFAPDQFEIPGPERTELQLRWRPR